MSATSSLACSKPSQSHSATKQPRASARRRPLRADAGGGESANSRMGLRVGVIASAPFATGGSRPRAGQGRACLAGRAAGASHVEVGRVATRLTPERLLRTPLVVRNACRVLCCRALWWRAVFCCLPARPAAAWACGRGQRRVLAGGAVVRVSVADLEGDDGDVRGDSVGLEVAGGDAAVVV